jgi:hypothetical protein
MSQIINQEQKELDQLNGALETSSQMQSFEGFPLVSHNLINDTLRAQFFTDADRTTLQRSQILRVRELEEINDDLQRQLIQKQAELKHLPHDPFNLLKEIENIKMTIAFNAGEILKIYAQNRYRLNRIAELEAQNAHLRNELDENEGKWPITYPMHDRANLASSIFLAKETIEKNNVELFELKKA